MIGDIIDLPPELGHVIYKYCPKSDLLNYACASRAHYESVKYLLHSVIRIPWKVLERNIFNGGKELDNLKHTSALRLVTYGLNSLFNKVIWDSVCEPYLEIIKYTDPNTLTTLKLESMVINMDNAMPLLLPSNLQEVSFYKCFGITIADWRYIGTMSSLRKLSVNQCNIDDSDLEHFFLESEIQDLSLIKCGEVTERGLKYLSNSLKLKKLRLVDCQGISPDGFGYLGELPSLNELELYEVHITDYSLSSFSKLSYINRLQIHCSPGNPYSLSDVGLSCITGLTSLEKLCINWLYITNHGLSTIPLLKSLTHLNISGCGKIGDNGFMNICKIKNLLSLDASCCADITDDGMCHVTNLQSLKILDLSCCVLITDVGLSCISKLTSLEELYLCQCAEISDKGLDLVCTLSRLRHLDISGCYDVTDFGLFHIYYYLQYLEVLKLMGCTKITNVGLSYLKSLNLTELDISLDLFSGQGRCMKINDAGMLHVSTITSLLQLNISCCDYISDGALKHLSQLKQLTRLNVSCCIKVSDHGLYHVSLLPSLRELDISMCVKVSDEGIGHLCRMGSLRKVDLHGCSAVTNKWPSYYPFIVFNYKGLLK